MVSGRAYNVNHTTSLPHWTSIWKWTNIWELYTDLRNWKKHVDLMYRLCLWCRNWRWIWQLDVYLSLICTLFCLSIDVYFTVVYVFFVVQLFFAFFLVGIFFILAHFSIYVVDTVYRPFFTYSGIKWALFLFECIYFHVGENESNLLYKVTKILLIYSEICL